MAEEEEIITEDSYDGEPNEETVDYVEGGENDEKEDEADETLEDEEDKHSGTNGLEFGEMEEDDDIENREEEEVEDDVEEEQEVKEESEEEQSENDEDEEQEDEEMEEEPVASTSGQQDEFEPVKGDEEEELEDEENEDEVEKQEEDDEEEVKDEQKEEEAGEEQVTEEEEEPPSEVTYRRSTPQPRPGLWKPEKEPAVVLQDVLENMMDEFALDVVRINRRYTEIRKFLITYFGTKDDGSISNAFDNHAHIIRNEIPETFFRRRRAPSEERSSFEEAVSRMKTRNSSREESTLSDISEIPQRDRRAEQTEREKRSAPERVGKVKYLNYPSFIQKSEEERIFKTCGNIASTYAQRMAKILFAKTIHLYFKDQERGKREWLHEAVDYRFPTPDKYSHATKWKNCSNAINKNMRDFQKDKKEKVIKELRYVYLTKEQEAQCYERAGGDAVKYGEYVSLILFEGSWDKFFKEQDQKRKDWMRECVDKRYPINDKDRRDHRWKIVAAGCNRNRTKVVGADGKENPFPYFPQELEEKCFKDSNGTPAVYAELMAKHLFPQTQHLMFKEQELGKRHWLHHHVDQRFPTPHKLEQAAKWKSITQAINKNKTEGPTSSSAPATPVEKHVQKVERKEIAKTRRSEVIARDSEEDYGEPENKRPRRAIKESMKMQEAQADSPPNPKKPTKNGLKSVKFEAYTRYPYVSQEKEFEIFENCKNNAQAFAKALGKELFASTIGLYYKEQHPERRAWMREIVDFRFPSANAAELKQKWKNCCASINQNRFLLIPQR